MKKNFSVLLVLVGLIIINCAGQKGETLTPKEFKNKITDKITLLDVRTPGEFQSGHIENALNIDINGSQFESSTEKLDKAKTVLVYCKAGPRSSRAAQYLRGKGYNVVELKGGIDAWKSDGMPVIK